MSVTLERQMDFSPSAVASDRDAIDMSPTYDAPEAWHDYSVDHGRESRLISLNVSPGHVQTAWNLHGLYRG